MDTKQQMCSWRQLAVWIKVRDMYMIDIYELTSMRPWSHLRWGWEQCECPRSCSCVQACLLWCCVCLQLSAGAITPVYTVRCWCSLGPAAGLFWVDGPLVSCWALSLNLLVPYFDSIMFLGASSEAYHLQSRYFMVVWSLHGWQLHLLLHGL